MKLGIDIGGTFTDLVLLNEQDGRMYFGKTLTTYPDPTLGILQGIEDLLQLHHIPLSAVHTLVHGTTLVTNAVIERKGVSTGLITTAGFEDVLEIGREMRYDIYDVFIAMPKPLVERHLRKGVTERIFKNGDIHLPLQEEEVRQKVDELMQAGVQSIAVVLLHAYANPHHEQIIGRIIRELYPDITVSLSSEVMPEIREYERSSATVMNAYVQPVTDHYLSRLEAKLTESGFRGIIRIMNSAGRLTTLDHARKFPIELLESGPAGGAMAGVFIGKSMGMPDMLAFDMGGTTAKAALIKDYRPEITNQFEAAREKRFKKGSGLPVRIPVIDMIEIGAGGGSLAFLNPLGLVSVGPESASSTPGPACYDRGGKLPTVTDADLVLGYLNEHYFLGGTMTLNREKAEEAIYQAIAKPLGISIAEAAWGIHRIVNENMANAARVHIIEKGFDPRFFSMLAFGGAGPVHAFHVARLLKSSQLIIPGGAGVLSALGFLVSPVATQEISSFLGRLDQMDWESLHQKIAAMREKANDFLSQAGIPDGAIREELVADMRYLGQGHEIAVPLPDGNPGRHSIPQIEENFRKEYQLRYGRSINHIPLESVTWRLTLRGPETHLQLHQTTPTQSGKALKGTREVFWGRDYESTPVYDRYAMEIGCEYPGPCIIEEFESTTVVGKHSTVRIDPLRHIVITLQTPTA